MENPHDNDGNLASIRDCEQQLRQCANVVGESFMAEAIPLCEDIYTHATGSNHRPLSWIKRDAKTLLNRTIKLCKGTHTLSQVADPIPENNQ